MDENDEDNDIEGGQSLENLLENTSSDDTIRSTKRPLPVGKQSVNKKKKKEAQEDILLQKAIQCMERSDNKEDEDDIFGRYVASELRSTFIQSVWQSGKFNQ